ncbi:hypothetical protein L915_02463, partial [Phytophthora nicotianae]
TLGPIVIVFIVGVGTRDVVQLGEFEPNSLVPWSSNKKQGAEKDDDYHGNFDAALFEK